MSGLLSMYLAVAQADPSSEIPRQLFEKIRHDIEFALQGVPLAVQQETRVTLDALLNRVSAQAESLSNLKPKSN